MLKYAYLAVALCIISTIAWGQAQAPITSFPIATTRVNTGELSVTNQNIGMKSGGFDNGPLVQTLINAQNGYLGYANVFPGNFSSGPNPTEYYFSQTLNINVGSVYECRQEGNGGAVILWFSAGIDGVRIDHTAPNPTFRGCQVYSLGYGSTRNGMTNGSTTIVGVSMISGTNIPAQPVAAGDGLIIYRNTDGVIPAGPATAVGAWVDSVSGSTGNQTVVMNSGFPVTSQGGGAQMYRLPAALMLNVTTTSGSPTVTVTGGTVLLHPGDLIWSDAFPFGSIVGADLAGTVGNQTFSVYDEYDLQGTNNATITHLAGSGKMWKIPVGLNRYTQSRFEHNSIQYWPVGIGLLCSGFYSNCTQSYDDNNSLSFNLIGRFASGNNTGASVSHANIYYRNIVNDIRENGSIGSLYTGDNSNSGSLQTSFPMVGVCNGINSTVYIGMYVDAAVNWNYCRNGGNASALFIGPQAGAPADMTVVTAAAWRLPVGPNQAFDFAQSGGVGGITGLPCFSPLSNSGVARVGLDCNNTSSFAWTFDATHKGWDMTGFAQRITTAAWTGYNPSGYSVQTEFPVGFLLGSSFTPGNENFLDAGSSAPGNSPPRIQGDWRLNSLPSAGGFVGWTNTANGANFHPFGPVSNDTNGKDWTLPTVRHTPVAFASLPASPVAGMVAAINNCDTACATWGGTANGNGANYALVTYNGTNWTTIGK